jgi:receptor expression-enhancing protein 5/6
MQATFVGTVYPSYQSFKAIETSAKDDDKKWLTYWVIFASLQNLEFFSGYIVFWIPFYQPLRLAFLIWCMLPIPSNGSKIIYDQVIKKFFLTQKDKIDGVGAAAAKAAGAATEAFKEATKEE